MPDYETDALPTATLCPPLDLSKTMTREDYIPVDAANSPVPPGRPAGPHKSSKPATALMESRLLHELEVHRIELEMQNEELRRNKAEIQSYLDKYTDLYDFAPVGYFTLSPEGVIRQVNRTGAKLVGLPGDQILNSSFTRLIWPGLRTRFEAFITRVFSDDAKQSAEFEMMGENRPHRSVHIEGHRSPMLAECRIVVVDITDRKTAENLMLRSKILFSTLVEQAPFGVFVIGPQFRLQQINPKALPLLGRCQPLIGRDFAEIIHAVWPEQAARAALERVLDRFRQTLETGTAYQSPELAERRDKRRFKEIYEWQIQRVTLPGGDYGVVCFFKNVTERIRADQARRRLHHITAYNESLRREIVRRQAVETALTKSEQRAQKLLAESRQLQEKLRHLSRNILRMQEDQRKEISRELHDGIVQLLVGINVRLAAFSKKATLDPLNIRKDLAPVHRLVTRSVHVVHQFARELRPAMLDELGLIPALRSYIEELPRRKGRVVHFHADEGVDTLDTEKRTVLYRVAQEALINVAKHARAREVHVSLHKVRSGVSLEICDDGKAFDVARLGSAAWVDRLGVSGMRERVDMVGGCFSIVSSPGTGTTIRAYVPGGRRRKSRPPASRAPSSPPVTTRPRATPAQQE
jgi:PAS domain S-box-containing protein